jgi:hypothetical protein
MGCAVPCYLLLLRCATGLVPSVAAGVAPECNSRSTPMVVGATTCAIGRSLRQSNHLLRVVVRKGRAGGLSGVIQSRRRHCPTRKCSPKRPNLGAPPHHYLHQSSRGATTGRRASHPGNYCCAGCDGAVSASALGVHGGRPRRGSLSLLNCEERK